MYNKKHFSLCSDSDIASCLPFKKENITRRYKNIPSKVLLYNAMQVITFMEINKISEKDLKIALNVLVEVKDDTEYLLGAIKDKVLQ